MALIGTNHEQVQIYNVASLRAAFEAPFADMFRKIVLYDLTNNVIKKDFCELSVYAIKIIFGENVLF